GAQQDDGDVARLAHAPADLDARQAGQHDVEDDELDLIMAQRLEGLLAVLGRLDVEPLAAPRVADRVDERRLVVDHQHARPASTTRAAGSRMSAVVPTPSSDSRTSVPPIASTDSRAMASPRPKPDGPDRLPR